MLLNLTFNNAFVFSQETSFSMKADMRSKRLASNIVTKENHFLLKSACIYGANNSGKTCLIRVLRSIKNVIQNHPSGISPNLYSKNPVISVICNFLQNNEEWEYSFKYNSTTNEFIYESFAQIETDQYKNQKTIVFYKKDYENNIFKSLDEKLLSSFSLISKNNILIHCIDVSSLEYLKKVRDVLSDFANSIVIVDMNNIPLTKTIQMLKNHDEAQKDIVSFIRNADLDLDDFKYQDNKKFNLKFDIQGESKPSEDVIAAQFQENREDSLRLTSYYKGHPVPSLFMIQQEQKRWQRLQVMLLKLCEKDKFLL